MAKSGKSTKTKIWIPATLLIFIIALCVTSGIMLMHGTETRETGNKETYSISALVCEANSPQNASFSSDSASSSENVIKITFKDNRPDKLAYNYVGNFETAEKAEYAKSSFHSDYNIDMGKNHLDPESLTPSFITVGTTTKINLYVAINNLNVTTAKYFFIKSEDVTKIQSYSEKNIQKLYENVGFKCKYNN